MREDGGPAVEHQKVDSGSGQCDRSNESGRPGADHNDRPDAALVDVPTFLRSVLR